MVEWLLVGPLRIGEVLLRSVRRKGRQAKEANDNQAQVTETRTDQNSGEKFMAETEALKPKIQGLLATVKYRGLEGQAAINQWTTSALECLLQAELARIETRSNTDDR